ncbi:MAG: transposase [Firmicutes bacterium]|nr:transposase [Bacillota bacterium]
MRKRAVVRVTNCAECPSRGECTGAAAGRAITIHPYEREIAAERKRQATPEFREFYAKRADGERVISHLTRHGARQGRFIGILKVWRQAVLAALNHNIKGFVRRTAAAA